MERRVCAREVEAVGHELDSLLEEVEVQHHLGAAEQQRMRALILSQLQSVDHERQLLSAPGPLDDLPDALIDTLVEAYHHGINRPFDKGYSPVHWSAQNGRRDLIEYLRRCAGGHELLSSKDATGRTPEVYAQQGGRGALAMWLREAAQEQVAVKESVPNHPWSFLPAPQFESLKQVEIRGWRHMEWEENFTLLHWAAKVGQGDLCRYLVELGADVHHVNAQGRSAVDLAQENGHTKLAAQLHELGGLSSSGPGTGHTQREDPEAIPRIRRRTVAEELKTMPEKYVQVMHMVEEHGWDTMKWTGNITLLHWAAKNDLPALCSWCLSHGGDLSAVDKDGKTPMDWAAENGSQAAMEQMRRGPSPEFDEEPLVGVIVDDKPRKSVAVVAAPGRRALHPTY